VKRAARSRRALALWGAAILIAVPAAAETKRYRDWTSSPEAYFLTREERLAWATVGSDEAAEAFVRAYRDARGAGFAAAIQSRIDFADRVFALGKRKGSATLRGRTLVLLGAPVRVSVSAEGSPVNTSDIGKAQERTNAASAQIPFSNIQGAGDSLRSAHAPEKKTFQTWVYDPGQIPVGDRSVRTLVTFEIDQDSGREIVSDPEGLEGLFAAVVAFWGPKGGEPTRTPPPPPILETRKP
jgi:GWxTD domain-containing protein